MISKEDWIGRRLVADRFRDRRVFICGDAAHLWIPNAGYGMNAGIADAANLSWMLAATLGNWAPPSILDAYEAERQPITEQVSRFTTDAGLQMMQQRREIPAEIEWSGPIGEATRARIGQEAYDIDVTVNNAPAASISDISMRARRSLRMTANRTQPTRCTISRRRRFPAVGRRICG